MKTSFSEIALAASALLAFALAFSCSSSSNNGNGSDSSSSGGISSSSEEEIDLTGCPEFDDAKELCDSRDKKIYKYVKIKDRIWMAENLNYAVRNSACYDNEPENCDKYGRLYDWETAEKICPPGWHLPTETEWNIIMKVSKAGTILKAKEGWDDDGNGEDNFGFAALPGGYGSCSSFIYNDEISICDSGNFRKAGAEGWWWSATEADDNKAMSFSFDATENSIFGGNEKEFLFSARCIKN